VLNRQTLSDDPRWKKESTITLGKSAKLVIEIASTNWSDEYALKLEDYEALGIEEYWICDYLGLGGKRYIGAPKQPTLPVYQLDEADEYHYLAQLTLVDTRCNQIVAPIFLPLTARLLNNYQP